MLNIQFYICAIVAVLSLVALLFLSGNKKKLDKIKAVKVGDNQHGSARWMNQNEAKKLYKTVILPKEVCNMSDSFLPGRIVDFNPNTREALIDTSDAHYKITAPTESGKTTEVVIPNIQYNIMAGTTMIIPDIKGELKRLTRTDAIKCGYTTYDINFMDIEKSDLFDYFSDINYSIEEFKNTTELKFKAMAEDSAGALAQDIVHSRDHNDSENPFFEKASKGVIHSMILLLSEFGNKKQRHVGSISTILQGMLEEPKSKTDKTPIILRLIRKLPTSSGARKFLGAAYAAMEETEGNIYASVLGDLEPFINSIAEQVIAKPGSSKRTFSYKNLINEKSIVYITIPENKEQFKVYASTIIRKLYNQLTDYASTQPNQKLPKRIYIPWEEMALYPKIQGVQDWLAIMRGRGLIADLIYQTDHQLVDKYGESINHILSEQCAVSIYLALSQEDTSTAERLSKALGEKTIKTGSISISYDNNKSLLGSANNSTTEQMAGRPLMTVDELLHLGNKEYNFKILLRRGQLPLKTHLSPYYTKDWGIEITPYDANLYDKTNSIEEIEYMTYNNLLEKIEQFELKQNEVKKSKILISELDPITQSPSFVDIAKKIIDLTNDEELVKMLSEERYVELYKSIDKYSNVISKYEFLKLIEPLQIT